MDEVLRLLATLNHEAALREIPVGLRGTHAVAAQLPDGSEQYFALEVEAHRLRVCEDDWSTPEPLCIDTGSLSRVLEGRVTERATFRPAGHALLDLIEYLLGVGSEVRA